MKIPFSYGKLAVNDLFINRNKEVEQLSASIESHINTILISPRRWGKSSLVNQVAFNLQKKDKKIKFCLIDLYSIRGEAEFYQVFATELIKATSSKWEDWIANGKKFFSHLIPRFQIGIDPVNDFSISFDWNEVKKSSDDILNLPEKISKDKKINIVVCIDEFQNIAHFDEPLLMQKKMRSSWQKHQHSTYCLYGSKRHMLAEIFENKSMPFYKFGETMFLEKIGQKHWIDFIMLQFSKTKKKISKELSAEIADRMENHPYFVQLYSASVWRQTKSKCNKSHLDIALNELFAQYELFYQRELDGLTNKQINFLKALVDEVDKFSSADILRDYQLGSQGNIKRMKTALENKEVIDLWGQKVQFIDPLFKLWFKKAYT